MADDVDVPAPKKRRAASGIERPKGVASQFRQTDTSDVEAVSKMFEGKEFCVVNGTKGLSKEEAERKIAEVRNMRRLQLSSNLLPGHWPHPPVTPIAMSVPHLVLKLFAYACASSRCVKGSQIFAVNYFPQLEQP